MKNQYRTTPTKLKNSDFLFCQKYEIDTQKNSEIYENDYKKCLENSKKYDEMIEISKKVHEIKNKVTGLVSSFDCKKTNQSS